jgi:hypothetical protein
MYESVLAHAPVVCGNIGSHERLVLREDHAMLVRTSPRSELKLVRRAPDSIQGYVCTDKTLSLIPPQLAAEYAECTLA